MASPIVIEIGITILALGVLLFFLAGFVSGEVVGCSIALVVVGVLLTVLGFAIGGRHRDDH